MRKTSVRRTTNVATVRSLVAIGLVAILTVGCGKDSAETPRVTPTTPGPTVTAATSASPTATPSPTPPPTDPAIIFAADGIGDYIIGKSLAELSTKLTGVFENQLCADSKGAEGTGRYADKITMTFVSNRLVSVHTTDITLVTPSGARVGMPITQIQSIYGARGTLITGTLGNKAFVVRVPASALAIVFFLDPSNTRVASMSGGEAQRLEDAARVGEGC